MVHQIPSSLRSRCRSLAIRESLIVTLVVCALTTLVTSAFGIGGVPLWTNIYTEPNNGFDVPAAMAIDGNGNVIVTGSSPRSGNPNPDFATVAYSNAGQPLWTNRYDGPVTNSDTATAVAVDATGRVFVTGYSFGGVGTGLDLATVAYSSTGIPLWTNRYNGSGSADDKAYGLACDPTGNVFVTGSACNGPGYDYATIKYSAEGVPLWINLYSDIANSYTEAYAIALDTNGNVYVTGYAGHAGTYDDFATVAYSSLGVPLRTNFYGAAGLADDRAVAIACDASGKVFVTGYSKGETSGFDYATIAYSNSGQPLWTNRYDGPASGEDRPTGMALDATGNVSVTGKSVGIGSDDDYATVMYSNSGVPVWTNRYNSVANSFDIPHGIAADQAGNIFVTGESRVGNTRDFLTIAYSNAGVPLWTNTFNGAGNTSDYAYAIAVDKSGNVFVTGKSFQGVTTAYDFVTIKYSSSIPSLAYLNFQKLNNQLRLSWTNAGYSLQSTPSCTGTFTNIPGATSPHTNAISGALQFFRLKAN